MGSRKLFHIGENETISGIQDCRSHFQDLMATHPPGEHWPEAEADQVKHLVRNHHPDSHEKIGAGVIGVSTDLEPERRSVCMYLHRADGTKTDVSLNRMLHGKRSKKAELSEACRRVVAEDIQHAKRNNPHNVGGSAQCDVTGHLMPISHMEIDHHVFEFSEIIKIWLWLEGLDLGQGLVVYNDLGSPQLSSQDLCDSFRFYHQRLAVLRFVSRDAHRSLALKARKPPKRAFRIPEFSLQHVLDLKATSR